MRRNTLYEETLFKKEKTQRKKKKKKLLGPPKKMKFLMNINNKFLFKTRIMDTDKRVKLRYIINIYHINTLYKLYGYHFAKINWHIFVNVEG